MLILLEGPDGAGKSSLAQRIYETLVKSDPTALIQFMHSGPPEHHPLVEYEARLFTYRPMENHHIICDRWHLGEQVYPAVLGRQSKYDRAMVWHTELFLQSRGALLVHVTADVATLRQRVSFRGDDFIKIEQLDDISRRFHEVIGRSILHKRQFYTSDMRYVEDKFHDLDSIIRAARMAERMHHGLAPFKRYVGPIRPDLLLLGDKIDAPARALEQVGPPAFMPYLATSGHYLLESLLLRQELRSVGRVFIGLGNACDDDDPRQLWRTLGEPTAVTLGREAWGHVNFKIARHVDHPQFVRRFHHDGMTEYADHIIDGKAPPWRLR